jgi:hypothetical protein
MTGTDTLTIGTPVRLLPRDSTVLPGHRMRGGEAVIVGVSEDGHGIVYRVRLTHAEDLRCARREHLMIHREGGAR